MKKNYLYIILLASHIALFSAEQAPTSLKQSLASLYQRAKQKLVTLVGGQTTPNLVESDIDDAVLISLVSPEGTAKLHQHLAKINAEISSFGAALQAKTEESQRNKTALTVETKALHEALEKRNTTIATLQQRIATLEQQPKRTQEGFEELEDPQDTIGTEADAHIMKHYQAALQENSRLEEQLREITAQYQALAKQFSDFSVSFSQSSRAKQLLQEKLSTAYTMMEEEEGEYRKILKQQADRISDVMMEKEMLLENRTALLEILTSILQQGALAQGTEYTRDFVRGFFDAIDGVTRSKKEHVIDLLFPVRATTEDDGTQIFES